MWPLGPGELTSALQGSYSVSRNMYSLAGEVTNGGLLTTTIPFKRQLRSVNQSPGPRARGPSTDPEAYDGCSSDSRTSNSRRSAPSCTKARARR